jgi:putative protein-disulfide isomerase
MDTDQKLFYIHDPMCSWCWGFDPCLNLLLERLPDSIEVVRLLGGLAPDSVDPMPEEMQKFLRNTWKKIETTIPGIKFNYNFWIDCRPRRSTWPACRAVIAARGQGLQYDRAMTAAIQNGYYRHAQNPSEDDTLVEFAANLGLDSDVFRARLNSEPTRAQLQREIKLSRRMGVQGFPSLRLLQGDSIIRIPVSYTDASKMTDHILGIIGDS